MLGGLYALLSQGAAVQFGVMRIINVAHGEFFLLGGYLGWLAATRMDADPFLSTPIIAGIGFIAGWLTYTAIIRPVVERSFFMPLLVTFGLALVMAGLMRLLFTTTPRLAHTPYSDVIVTVMSYRIPLTRGLMFAVSILFLIVLLIFLKLTKAGKAMRAVAQNKEAAKVVGISLNKVRSIAFGLGGALAFGAGALFAATQSITPFMGPELTLKAVAITVAGGMDRVAGISLAALLLALTETFLASYVPGIGSILGVGVGFVLLVVLLVLRPEGLMRSSKVEQA